MQHDIIIYIAHCESWILSDELEQWNFHDSVGIMEVSPLVCVLSPK